MKIDVIQGMFSKGECALIARTLFDRRKLWESRSQRKVSYRNGDWFTVGSSLYLDITCPEDFHSGTYAVRTNYWNAIIDREFLPPIGEFKNRLAKALDKKVGYLSYYFKPSSLPGFHIFGPEETNQVFFGKVHQDKQWETLLKMPGFLEFLGWEVNFGPDQFLKQFPVSSFTLPIILPFMGGGMLDEPGNTHLYQIGNCYMHDGLSKHAIAPSGWPVLPNDWRITLQCHGIEKDGVIYLYW